MTKKRSSEILADENGKFCREKVKCLKFSTKSKKFPKIGGNPKQGIKLTTFQTKGVECPTNTLLKVSIVLLSVCYVTALFWALTVFYAVCFYIFNCCLGVLVLDVKNVE